MRISDSGAGMKEDVRQRMFDPFFTTKSAGAGQGLGLAVVHGIMQSHRGLIDVSSEPGKGTTVQLFFPISPVAEEKARPPAEAAVPRLRSIDPDARVLLASGYFDVELKKEMLGAGARAFLRKPYSAEEILRHTRAVLDSPKRPQAPKAKATSRRGEALQ